MRKAVVITRRILGTLILVLGIVLWIIAGIGGLICSGFIVMEIAGFWGLVIGGTILPVTFTVAPWYALLEWGSPIPLIISYGGGIAGFVMFTIGSCILGLD